MEGLFVLFSTLAMFFILIIYFFWNTSSKTCPKCKKTMFSECIDGKPAFICKMCGHIEYKNKKHIKP
jgi:tRNA(Ile2) C34 agmatinyltransferase TiaS